MSEDLRVKKRKWKLGDVEEGFIQTTKRGMTEVEMGTKAGRNMVKVRKERRKGEVECVLLPLNESFVLLSTKGNAALVSSMCVWEEYSILFFMQVTYSVQWGERERTV